METGDILTGVAAVGLVLYAIYSGIKINRERPIVSRESDDKHKVRRDLRTRKHDKGGDDKHQ
jgi:hypothetical protein